MSKRAAADTDADCAVAAPPLRAPECRRDKQRLFIVRDEDPTLTTHFQVSKKLAYALGLDREWKVSKQFGDATRYELTKWLTICRLSCASYDVKDPAAALASVDPYDPSEPFTVPDRSPTKEERELPLVGIVMVYGWWPVV